MQNGNLMAYLRIQKDISQRKMAQIINVSLSSYKAYENNEREIKLNILNLISNYFNISLNSLLGLTSNLLAFNNNENINYLHLQFSLRLIRKKNHFKQKEISKMFNLSTATICKYEKNPQLVSISYLYLFAKQFNISVDYLCGKTLKKEIL